jgi:hypothetical protein
MSVSLRRYGHYVRDLKSSFSSQCQKQRPRIMLKVFAENLYISDKFELCHMLYFRFAVFIFLASIYRERLGTKERHRKVVQRIG